MPEGPSIVILKEAVAGFKGKQILRAEGTTQKIDLQELEGRKISDFKTWGKHFLICFDDFTIKIHLLLFGSYLINDTKKAIPKLRLQFESGEINFYACALTKITADLGELYDWEADIMSSQWNAKKAAVKLKLNPDAFICDILLDQNVFAGLGNIIKNEVLYRIRIHPESSVGNLPPRKVKELMSEVVHYGFQFLEWKKENTLKSHFLAQHQKICLRCDLPMIKKKAGKTNRTTFLCEGCQVKY